MSGIEKMVEWLELDVKCDCPICMSPQIKGIIDKAKQLLAEEQAQTKEPASIIGPDGIGIATGTKVPEFQYQELTPEEEKAFKEWHTKLKQEKAKRMEKGIYPSRQADKGLIDELILLSLKSKHDVTITHEYIDKILSKYQPQESLADKKEGD